MCILICCSLPCYTCVNKENFKLQICQVCNWHYKYLYEYENDTTPNYTNIFFKKSKRFCKHILSKRINIYLVMVYSLLTNNTICVSVYTTTFRQKIYVILNSHNTSFFNLNNTSFKKKGFL